MKHVKTSLFTAVGTAVLALLAGCASQPPATPQDIVRARAQERIDLVHNKDYDKAYGYLLPSYRKLNDAGTWGRRFGNGAKWVDPKVASAKCTETDRCQVGIELGVIVVARGFSASKPIQTTMYETWLLEDGQWWFYQP
jgi:hypothetical protein